MAPITTHGQREAHLAMKCADLVNGSPLRDGFAAASCNCQHFPCVRIAYRSCPLSPTYHDPVRGKHIYLTTGRTSQWIDPRKLTCSLGTGQPPSGGIMPKHKLLLKPCVRLEDMGSLKVSSQSHWMIRHALGKRPSFAGMTKGALTRSGVHTQGDDVIGMNPDLGC